MTKNHGQWDTSGLSVMSNLLYLVSLIKGVNNTLMKFTDELYTRIG